MKVNPVGWFEIYVQNMDRAKVFYEAVLSTTLEKLNSPGVELWAFPMDMKTAGASGALVKMEGVSSGGNSTLVYFSCADCATEAARVVAAGGRVMKPKFSIGEYGFISLVFDTEDNLFGLHSMS
jgi:predicted enzyme related to lactoylglutathione lyase